MANSLFKYKDVHNSTHRSGFDLSFKNAFTAKTGEMLPVHWQFIYPGDNFDVGCQWFTRTQPVNTAAYTRIREYVDWFFVPMHLLWKSFDTVITQMTDSPVQATSISGNANLSANIPYFSNLQSLRVLMSGIINSTSPVNQFGFTRADLSQKLLEYLDYGNMSTSDAIFGTSLGSVATNSYTQRALFQMAVNPLPLFAYHKIYQDYVRNSQWEKAKPYLWNVDYSSGGPLSVPNTGDPYYNNETLIDLHYWNWNKDLFMGVLPNTQYGDVASINFSIPGTGIPVTSDNVNVIGTSPVNVNAAGDSLNINGAGSFYGSMVRKSTNSPISSVNPLSVNISQLQSSFNVLQLHQEVQYLHR